MKRLINNKIIPVLIIAVALVLFAADFSRVASDNRREIGTLPDNNIAVPASRDHERVIYTCRLGDEEIPAIQIYEATNGDGLTTATIARAAVGDGIEVRTRGVAPVWDYKALSARSDDALIDITFAPEERRKGYDWVLTLADENTYFRSRVRDCTEVSDE